MTAGIGAKPALVDAVTRRIPAVTISAPSTTLCQLQDVDATATLTGVRRSRGTTTIQHASASIVLTQRTLAGRLSNYQNVTVTPDPGAGTLVIRLGPAGLLQVHEQARLDGDTIQLSPSSASVLGRPCPRPWTRRSPAG